MADEAVKVGVRLKSPAIDRLVTHLGENVSSLDGILRTLASTYGEGSTIGPEQVEPFLGDAGGVPPWDLTDAIDAGRTSTALDLLGRMLGAGERHPLQVMAILQGHYGKLATLDGLGSALGGRGGRRARDQSRDSRPRKRSSCRAGSGAPRSARRSTSWPAPTSTCAAARSSTTT